MSYSAEEVARVLRLGEDHYNEFKSVPHKLPDVAPTLAAFANSGGGRLWLGVEDNGSVSGVRDPDDLQKRLDDVFRDKLLPALNCPVAKVEHQGKLLLVVEVPGYAPHRPYRVRNGEFYVRAAASNRPATPEEVRHIILSASLAVAVPDELPVPGTRHADLDAMAFREFHQRAYDENAPLELEQLMRLLVNLKLATGDGLTLAGLLCFGRDPQRFLPLARISAARVAGKEAGGDDLDRKEFGGTLEAQIVAAEDFVVRHMQSPVAVRGLEPEKSSGLPPEHSLPLEAVREIVRNAVVHRDYGQRSQILVSLYDDRLEIASPGRLLNMVTIASVKVGVRMERNQIIVGILAKLGYLSERGTGIPRTLRVMRQAGLAEPAFEERGPMFVVTLPMRRAT